MSKFYKRILVCCWGIFSLFLMTQKAIAQAAFTPGHILVYRIGDGSTALSSTSSDAFYDEYTTSGVFVQSVAVPTSGNGRLVHSGSATSEGYIVLSQDSTLVSNAGYDATVGTASIANTTAAAAPRASDTLNILGAIDRSITTSTLLGGSSNNNRSAVKGAANDFWEAGAGGVAYIGYNNTASIINSTNTRIVQIFNGNMYYSTGSGTQGIYKITGTPNAGPVTPTALLTTNALGGGTSPYGFSINSTETIIYVADDGAGISKYTYNGTVWSRAYTYSGASNQARGLIVDWSGTNPVLYAIPTTGASLLKIIDNGSVAGSTITTTTLSSAVTNTILRGIAFAPMCVTPTLATPAITNLCTSGSVTLNASSYAVTGLSYIWKNNGTTVATTSTPTYSTTTAGTYTVTASTGYCNRTAATSVVITGVPIGNPVFTLGATSTRCQGAATVSYSATASNSTGIVYTLDATTSAYLGNSINSLTGDVTYAAGWSGTSIITATAAGCAGPTTANHTVTVKPLPVQPASFTASTSSVCQGQTGVTYTVANDATVTYNWSYSGTGATITGTSNSVTVAYSNIATSGTLSVTATANNGCGISTALTLPITVNPLPAQPAPFTASTTTVCQGTNNVTYTVPNDPTVTYNWTYNGAGTTINGTGNSVTVSYSTSATSGTLSVTATATNGCGISAARTLAITVNPLPNQPATFTVSNSSVCQGQSNVTYTVPNDATVTYNWTYTGGTGATITGSGNSVTVSYSSTATSGTLNVTATAINGCGISIARSLAVTVKPLPAQPAAFTTSTATVCQGTNNVTYTVPNDATVTYAWTYSGGGATITPAGNTANVSFSSTATSGALSVTATAINGCGTSTPQSIAITINPLPNQPAAFTTSSATVCQGTNNVTYTVPNDPLVTYNWSYSGTGAAITPSGNTASVSFSSTATSGTLNVTATAINGCGTSLPRGIAVTVSPLPNQPAAFTISSATVCQGTNNVTYTVPNDPLVTYNWTYTGGTGATITGTGNSVAVSYGTTATSGTLSVTATAINGCGISAARTLGITVNPLPNQPAAFTTSTATVCQGTSNVTYTVPNDPLVTYNWSYSGTGATITPSGNTASINFSNTATSGTLNVTATAINGCGTSTARGIAVTINPLPNQPAAFSISTGVVCQGQSSVSYAVPNDATVTYNWTYTGTGATITGTSNVVTVAFSNTATSGTLNVTATAINGCGISAARGIAITVNPLPQMPAAFTVSNASVCQGTNNVNYTVPNDATVTYNWAYTGTGVTITPAGNTANVSFSNAATSGTLNVTATAINGCGISSPRSLAITVKPLPAQPAAFTASTAAVCQGQSTVTYTVPNDASVTYSWTYSGAGATITGTTNSVTVNFSNTATSGTLSVIGTAVNGCGISAPRSIAITVNPLPTQPAAFTAAPTTVCQGQNNVTYTVPNDPAVTYNWTYTGGTGATITGTGNSVTVSYSATATSGTLNVAAAAINGCGTTIARSIAITVNPLPNQPAAFTTSSATVCQGQSTVTYTVPNDPAVTYNWTYSGTGAIITGTTNSVTVSFNNTATSGTLGVTATAINGCGISAASTIAITVNQLPAQPAAFTAAPAVICQGQSNVVYTVPNVSTVTYNWTYSGAGATITGTGNSVTVSFSNTATSGTLSVTATAINGCGISIPRNTTITVSPVPNQPAAFTTSTTTVCQGQTNVIYTVPNDATVTYNWSYTGSGAAINGTGNSVSVNYNTTATSGNIQVTATAINGCGISSAQAIPVTVNPLPLITITPSAQNVCNNTPETITISSSVINTTYTWTNTLPSTGAPATGIASSVPFTALNTGNASVTDTIIVIPTANSCIGPKQKAYVIVNPTPGATATPLTQTVCNGIAANVTFSSSVTTGTTTYSWTNNMTAIGLGNSGTGNVSFNSTNTSTTPDTATIIVIPSANGCVGAAKAATIIVTPLPTVSINIPAQSLCTGAATTPINFSTTVPGTAYTWVNNNTLTGVAQNGVGNIASVTTAYTTIPITSTITVTPIINGCAGVSQQATITVNPYPQATVFANNGTTSCVNDSVVLNANTGAGYTYQWLYNGSPISNATASVYAAHATGYYSVSVKSIGCLSTSTQTAVLVKAIPAAPIYNVGGTLTHCIGDSVMLGTITNILPPYTYQWQNNGTDITGATNVDYTAHAAGNYDVKVFSNGCSNTSPILTVIENPNPAIQAVIAASSFVCPGGTDALQVDSQNNAYQWYSNNNPIPGASSGNYGATNAGNYTVGITNSFGCTTFSLPVSISAGTAPILNVALQNKQLCVQGTGYTNFQWYLNGVAIPNATNGCYDPGTLAGGYTVSAANNMGCYGTSSSYYYSTGVANITPAAIKLYPNPATNVVNINAPEPVNVMISSMDGKQLMYVADAKTIDISKLVDAVYLIKVYDVNNTLIRVEKLVKAGW